MMRIRSVALLGASGLVGSECFKLLSQDPSFEHITVLGRRPWLSDFQSQTPPSRTGPQCTEHVFNFDNLLESPHAWMADCLINCLGTTMKKAKTKENFYRVDYSYPLQIAQLAPAQGVKSLINISAHGAHAQSRIFYNRVKGELETALNGVGFDSVTHLRPSLLLGERQESRVAEAMGRKLGALLSFALPLTIKPIPAAQVAVRVAELVHAPKPGIAILESAQLQP